MGIEHRIQVCWEPKASHLKTAKLHYRFFGRRVRVKGQVFYYDGLLAGFKNGRRIKLVNFERFGPTNISMPADLQDTVIKLFGELRIDHRVITYDARNNLFSKTYTSTQIFV